MTRRKCERKRFSNGFNHKDPSPFSCGSSNGLRSHLEVLRELCHCTSQLGKEIIWWPDFFGSPGGWSHWWSLKKGIVFPTYLPPRGFPFMDWGQETCKSFLWGLPAPLLMFAHPVCSDSYSHFTPSSLTLFFTTLTNFGCHPPIWSLPNLASPYLSPHIIIGSRNIPDQAVSTNLEEIWKTTYPLHTPNYWIIFIIM